MKKVFLLGTAFLLSACFAVPTPQPTASASAPYVITAEDNPYGPKPEDSNLRIAGVTIMSINLSERFDLTPTRVTVNFSGSLPSVCNKPRIKVSPPDAKYQILIEIYSLLNPNIKCDNVFQRFEINILLGVYSNGRYTVWVNGQMVGDFVTY